MRIAITGTVRWPGLPRLRPALLALLLCGSGIFGVFSPLFAPLLGVQAQVVRACGLGNTPTMFANTQPSLLQPVTKDTPIDQPIGAFGPDFTVGQSITFSEDLSNMAGAPPVNSLKWRWTFGDGATSSAISPTHTFTKPGTYKVASQILVQGIPTDFDSSAITIVAAPPSNPPVVVATSTTSVTDANTPVTFDAAGSHSQDGSQLKYLWNFADGSTSTDPHVTHTFGAPLSSGATTSKSVVALIITDDHGARSVALLDIEVVPGVPKAHVIVSSTSVSTGDTVTFDASASSAPSQPANDALAEFTWNFGDGSPQITTTTATYTHTFQKTGRFTVTIQAIDQQGYPGVTTVTITVGRNWTPFTLGALALLALAVGGYFAVQAQRRRNALIRRSAAAMELARARAVQSSRALRERERIPSRRLPPPAGAPRQPQGPPPRGLLSRSRAPEGSRGPDDHPRDPRSARDTRGSRPGGPRPPTARRDPRRD
jgi:PKD repeat protein